MGLLSMLISREKRVQGLRLRVQGSKIRAWSIEKNPKFAIRNCPSDSHPSGGFPVSQFEIKLLAPDNSFAADGST
jgi:hypothetical protein